MAHFNPSTFRWYQRSIVKTVALFLALANGPVFTVKAQVATGYTFAQSPGTFTAVTGGTQLQNTTFFFFDINAFNDQVSAAQTIPAFNYNGTVYTQMYVSANGFITFGSAPTGTNYAPLSSAETYAGAVSAVGCDLHNTTNSITGTRDIRWVVQGSEIVVQWRGVRRQGVGSEGFAFQIRLNTATSAIRMVYGPFNQGPGANASIIPEVGLRGSNNTFATNVNNRLVGTGAENWGTSLAGAANNSKVRLTNTAPAKAWTSGLTYTWTPCTTPVATFTVQNNCAAQQFSVNVDVTSFGGGSSGVITYSVDNGAPSTQNVAALGTTSIGPFPVARSVQASFSSNLTGCGSVASGTLFSNCPVDLLCGNTLSVYHCYANNDTRTFTYTASDPLATVTVTFISGTMAAGDVLQAYDGTDETGTPLSGLTGSFPNLTNASATSIGPSIFVKIVSDGSNSCSTGQQTSWQFEVECTAACSDPDGVVNVNMNCGAFNFNLDVEILSVGASSDGMTTLRYTVNGGSPVLIPGLIEFQVQNIGPFALTDVVNVRLLHTDNATCDRNLGNHTRTLLCPPTNDLCASAQSLTVGTPGQCPALATAGSTFDSNLEIAAPACGGAGTIGDVWYTFNSGWNTSPIAVNITAGTATHWGVEIWTACGGTMLSCTTGSPATVNFSAFAEQVNYRIRVFTNTTLGTVGSFSICLSATPLPTSCGTVIRDPGGTGNYSNNQNVTTTYCSGTAQSVMMTFSQFATELNFDFVRVYDGPSTASPLLGTFSGNSIPGPFLSSHPTGCLTVNFTSDGSQTGAGYTANLTCCNAPVPTASASNNGPLCAGATLQLNSTTNIGTLFSWTGPGGFTSTLQDPTIVGATTAASGTYFVTVTNGVSGCPRTVSTTVSISGTPGPVNAGPDQTVCASLGSATMGATVPTSGTGNWSNMSGGPATITTPGSATTTITGLTVAGSPYTFRWTVSNAPCASEFEEVVVTVNPTPTTSVAGGPQTICSNGSALLAANTPTFGTGAWNVVSGPSTSAAQFSSTGNPNATFTPTGGAGTYTLRWRITNAPCTPSNSTLVLTVNVAPGAPTVNTASYAICQNTTVPAGQGLSASCPTVAQNRSTAFPGSNFISEGTAITTRSTMAMPALPAGAVVTAARLRLFNVVANTSFLGDAQRQNIRVALSGAYVLGETQLTATTGPGTVSPDPVINLVGFPAAGGSINLRTRQTSDQFWTNPDATIASALIEVDYTVPSSVRWYDAPSSGTLLFTGSVFDPVGQGAVPNSTPSTNTFHATCGFNSCESIRAPTTFVVVGAPVAGSNGAVTVCSNGPAISLAAQLGGSPQAGGAWTGPSAVVGDTYDPSTMLAGVYTYTVTGTAPCPNATAAVTVTETPAIPWYADTDGDGFGSGAATLACSAPFPTDVTNNTDLCPDDGTKQDPGVCGCGVADVPETYYADTDGDGFGAGSPVAGFTCIVPGGHVLNNTDLCPTDGTKQNPGQCGCGNPDTDTDGDLTADCNDLCPADPNKIAPGQCGCGVADVPETYYADTDGDGFGAGSPVAGFTCILPGGHVLNNTDLCPTDGTKQNPGQCGCGNPDTDTDGDLTADCNDLCPADPNKIAPGQCGCGNPDTDSDNDSIADCVDACPLDPNNDLDADGICGDVDNCPTVFGEIGNICDAQAGPGFTLGELNNSCACIAATCTQNLTIEFQTDANPGQITWELHEQGTNTVLQAGAPLMAPNGIQTVNTCVPNGCYYLKVLDSGGDGIVNGGYILRTAGSPGTRIIDNRRNFTSGSVSQIAGNESFCFPMGSTTSTIFTSCDKLDWTTGQYVVCGPVPAVAALWNAGNTPAEATTGYEFQIFNPNGGYIFNRFRSHNVSDGFAPDNASRACHMKINNWALAQQIPANVLMNVRVRTRINGVNGNWGAACRFKIDPVQAACPLTKLIDIPGDANLSCNSTRVWGTGNYIHARPISGATQYQWRFRIDAESFITIRTTTTYFIQLNWPTLPLQNGKTYQVEVRAFKGGAWCIDTPTPAPGPGFTPWGDVCDLTIDNTPANGGNENMLGAGQSEQSGGLRMYPNPNRGDQLYLSLEAVDDGLNTVSVDIFDLTGKIATTRTIAITDGMLNTAMDLNDLPGGVYMVNVTAGAQRYTKRLVIQK